MAPGASPIAVEPVIFRRPREDHSLSPGSVSCYRGDDDLPLFPGGSLPWPRERLPPPWSWRSSFAPGRTTPLAPGASSAAAGSAIFFHVREGHSLGPESVSCCRGAGDLPSFLGGPLPWHRKHLLHLEETTFLEGWVHDDVLMPPKGITFGRNRHVALHPRSLGLGPLVLYVIQSIAFGNNKLCRCWRSSGCTSLLFMMSSPSRFAFNFVLF